MLSEGKEIISEPTQLLIRLKIWISTEPYILTVLIPMTPSIIRILQEGYSDNNFSFDLISDLDIQNVINKIDSSKAYQKGNIPPQIIKINADICSMTLVYDINKCINNGVFPDNLKHADITPTFKKTNDFVKQIINLYASCLHFQRCMKNFFIIKSINTLIIYSRNTCVVSERVKVPNMLLIADAHF